MIDVGTRPTTSYPNRNINVEHIRKQGGSPKLTGIQMYQRSAWWPLTHVFSSQKDAGWMTSRH